MSKPTIKQSESLVNLIIELINATHNTSSKTKYILAMQDGLSKKDVKFLKNIGFKVNQVGFYLWSSFEITIEKEKLINSVGNLIGNDYNPEIILNTIE